MTPGAKSSLPEVLAVVGGGLMGCGIASVCARAGRRVVVYESDPSRAASVLKTCEAIFAEQVGANAISREAACDHLSAIRIVSSLQALAGYHFVIEAITEALEAKRALYDALEAILPADAIIASSTSGFTPSVLSERMRNRGRFLVAHFWNPPHLIPLVEVLGSVDTVPQVLDRTMELLRRCDCEPVELRKAVPGFIGNRLQFAVLREALHLLREEVADAATIDAVMKSSLGRRYAHFGPLESADLGGLDTFLRISRHLMPDLAKGEDVLDTLQHLVSTGRSGHVAGQGFYLWDAEREASLKKSRALILQDRAE